MAFPPRSPLRRRPWLLALLGALLVVVTAMVAAPRAQARADPIPVRVLMPSVFAEATADQVRRFNRSHPGLRLEVARGPLDTEAISDLAIGSLLLGETPYDLLMMDVTWTAKFVAAGWLKPLEPWLDEGELEAMVPGARLGNRFGGHLWRMPFSADTGLLYWRTDLMEKPPRSTAELVEISRSLQQRGKVRWGYVWQGRQYEGLSCTMLEVLHAFGGDWWESVAPSAGQSAPAEPGTLAGGRTVLDSPQAQKAASWLSMLVRSGISPEAVANFAENEALQVFAAGEAAFLRNWPYAWREIEKGGGPVVGKVGVTTLVSETGEPVGGTLGTWGLSLLAGSPHPAEAAEVIRWLSGPEIQRELVLSQGYAPTWQALYDDPELQRRHPLLEVQRQALAAGPLVRPLTPLYPQFSDVLQRQVNGMLTARGSAATAMANAQGQSEVIVRSAAGSDSR